MNEEELIKKYGLDIEALKKDQLKIAKEIVLKDSQDFSLVTRIAAIDNIIVNNSIISVVIVCDKEYNVVEQQYFLEKLRFPYLAEFRSYRELPAMMAAFDKLNEKPDVVFIHGHGITHPRLGLASHFSIVSGVPSLGVADNLFECDRIKDEDILVNDKLAGKLLKTKEKANPLYVSPGSGISVDSTFSLVKNSVKFPHKLPEPLHIAHKYAREVKDELKL